MLLEFNKQTDSFWCALGKTADKKKVYEVGDTVLMHLYVRSVSLDHHQFIRFKISVDGRNEVQLWIPRNIVKMISEGKSDLSAAFTFAGKSTK